MEFSKDIDTSTFDTFDFGFELVDNPVPETPATGGGGLGAEVGDLSDQIDAMENKINNILSILSLNDSTDDIRRAIEDQGVHISSALEAVDTIKMEYQREYERKLEEIEKLVLPLLVNLTKNPDREYIRWPNRAEAVQNQINKILQVTRNNGD